MAITNFGTANEEYRKLMANGTQYRVPRFQRDYSWSEENWDDLWLDIVDLLEGREESHYMGYLVLQRRADGRAVDVIDGQQRLTTISIIVLSALRVLQRVIGSGSAVEENRQRLEEIRRTYIGTVDTVSLNVNPKLILNRNNDNYYQNYLTNLRPLPARNLKASVHQLRKASDWFERKIEEKISIEELDRSLQGSVIAKMVERLADGLFFTVITVADELNAYKVFETLNARGVKLSAPDLLKNYLFSVISRETQVEDELELDKLELRWSELLTRLASENFTTFLRTHWGARNAFVREAELFKVIKRGISSRAEAYKTIQEMEDDVETYLSLSSPETSELDFSDKNNATLLKRFSVRQPFALLMAVQRQIPQEFSRVLSAIVKISMRYNVIGSLQAAEQERVYARAAVQVSRGELTTYGEVIQSLRSIYPRDDTFETSFATKEFDASGTRNRFVVKYILGKIEAHSHGGGAIENSDLSIEHVLPMGNKDAWPEFSEADAVSYTDRLGNLLLLEPSLNREAGEQSYENKKAVLRRSGVAGTASLPDQYEVWNRETVERRQAAMARVAKTLWSVEALQA